MNAFQKPSRLFTSAVLLAFSVLAVLASSASAIGEPTTITFKELEKGSTFHFLDHAPEATLKHGVASFSRETCCSLPALSKWKERSWARSESSVRLRVRATPKTLIARASVALGSPRFRVGP